MSMRTRSSKKEASASKQLAPSQSIKKEEKSSKHMASSQPSVGQITVDSQIKTYRQILQQEIDKQGCMQTLPDKAQVDHQSFLQVKARASSFLSAAKTDEDYIGRLSQVLLELKDLNTTASSASESLREDNDSELSSD
ncbi:hypothetical protein CRG98_011510 [Punica granatum]|uniref:Uncharacterized protein n=1 Tax=Punica granatum TaxID=22663 RepID=A0A2I0KHE1_PUNGR|nr:hypothetical protein CRG98_011510 [Punica granatum]